MPDRASTRRVRLGDVPRQVVQLVDAVRHHAQAAVVFDDREAVALPRDRHEAIAELGLAFERDARATTTSRRAAEDLVAQVRLDRSAVDRLDHGAEHLPAGDRVVRRPSVPGSQAAGVAAIRARASSDDRSVSKSRLPYMGKPPVWIST